MRNRFAVTNVLFIASLFGVSADAGNLDEARLQELREQLQPAGGQLWRTIPWKIDLVDAQQTAAEERKPIFIWAMDGHPLGCT